MKKITAAVLSLVLAFSVFCGCGKKDGKNEQNNVQQERFEEAKLEEGVIATVNDEKITVDEIKFYLAQYVESIYSQNGMLESTTEDKETFWAKTDSETGEIFKDIAYYNSVDAYVGLVSMVNLAKEKGLEVTDEEFQEGLKQEGIEEAINHYIDTYGVAREAIDIYLKNNMLYEKYATEYIDKDERMNITDEKLKEKFEADYIKAQHILKLTQNQETREPLSEEEQKAAKEKIDSILEQVKAPEADFQAIMLEESEDPGSAQQPDGYVFKEGEMVTEFYETAKALKENEISDVVETSYGYHIIKRLPLNMEIDFEAAKDSIANEVKTEVFNEILTESKEKMTIKVDYDQLNAITGILY